MTPYESKDPLGYGLEPVSHDPFIDDISEKPNFSTAVNMAEVPQLDGLVREGTPGLRAHEGMLPPLPTRAQVLAANGLSRVAAQRHQNGHRPGLAH